MDVILTSALIMLTIAVSTQAQAVDSTTNTIVWECDFEETSPCDLVQDPTDTIQTGFDNVNTSYDWQVNQGTTLTSGTGPDVAQSNSSYYFVEVSDTNPGDFTRLASARLNHVGTACLSFWYYMYGARIAQLLVYVQGDLRWGTGELVYLENGDQGRQWIQGKVNIELTDATQRVVFHGVAGDGFQGDIAIDNVEIFAGACTGTIPESIYMTIRNEFNSVYPVDAMLCPGERLQCVWSAPPSNSNATLKWVLASNYSRLSPLDTDMLSIPPEWRGQVLTLRCIATLPAGYDVYLDIITDCPLTTTTTTTSTASSSSVTTAAGGRDCGTGGGEAEAGAATGAVVAGLGGGLAAVAIPAFLFYRFCSRPAAKPGAPANSGADIEDTGEKGGNSQDASVSGSAPRSADASADASSTAV